MAQLDFIYKDSDNTYLAHFNDYSQKLSKLIANKPMDKVTSDTIYFKFEQKELCDAFSCSVTLLNSILESVSRHPCGLEWHEGNEYYRKSIKPLLLIFFGKKGGVKSGEIRREKKRFKELFLSLLEDDCKADKNKPKKERRTNKELFVMRMMKQAIDGDLNSQKYIIEMIGEAPSKKVEVTGANGTPLIERKTLTKKEIKELLDDLEKEI